MISITHNVKVEHPSYLLFTVLPKRYDYVIEKV